MPAVCHNVLPFLKIHSEHGISFKQLFATTNMVASFPWKNSKELSKTNYLHIYSWLVFISMRLHNLYLLCMLIELSTKILVICLEYLDILYCVKLYVLWCTNIQIKRLVPKRKVNYWCYLIVNCLNNNHLLLLRSMFGYNFSSF